jgi:hypothetical protein
MYCTNCGISISFELNFCSSCGLPLKLNNKSNQINSDQYTLNHIEKYIGIKISKQLIGFYLIWIVLHLILFLTNGNSYCNPHDKFWPMSSNSSTDYYDFSEFLFYTLIPLICIVIYQLFQPQNTKIETKNKLQYDLSFEKDKTPAIIGIMLLFISLLYFILSENQTSINSDTYRIQTVSFSLVSLIMRILITIWVRNISKVLNRKNKGWIILAFCLPAITLIIISQKQKLIK